MKNMKILVDMGHPAHVHFFRNAISILKRRGHEIKITVRDRENILELLDSYNLEYEVIGKRKIGLLNKVLGIPEFDYRLYRIGREFRPDVFTSIASMYAAQVSKLLGKPCISFDDTEHSREQYLIYAPFTDVIYTPSCFKKNLGSKQIRYDGLQELAYLHPNYFTPDPTVLDDLNLTEKDKFIVLRFVSWTASHDVMQHGIKLRKRTIRDLEDYGRVFISSEGKLDERFTEYKLRIPVNKIHSLLYYAQMYYGEGATMASEAGLLGTPSIYISSLANSLGNFEEMRKYGLVYSYEDSKDGLDKVLTLLKDKDVKKKWRERREKLLKDKIDVTDFMVNSIEKYSQNGR